MRDDHAIPQRSRLRPLQSTDLGNVSYEVRANRAARARADARAQVPVIQPVFDITGSTSESDEQITNHTRAFARLARSRDAHDRLIKACRGVGATALRMLTDTAFTHEVKAAHETDRRLRMRPELPTRLSWTHEPV
jgi:hypothetical protein